MSTTNTKPRPVSPDEILVATLQRRLNDGWFRIEEADRRGEDVAAWESFWIDLLHQYEAAWDRLLPEAAR